MTPADRRADEALGWARRLHDPSFSDWDAHVLWLESDPLNATALDEAEFAIADASDGLAPLPILPIAVNDNPTVADRSEASRRGRRAGIAGIAVAASIAAIVAVSSLVTGHTAPMEIISGPGEHRTISLADGTTIALNGDSRLQLNPAAPRLVTLERGEAYFAVAHDAAHTFEVRSGDATFRDIGTQFDVIQQPSVTKIAVREGAVLFDPGSAAVRIDGGNALRIAAGSATLRPVAAEAIGGWRSGRLTYRDTTLVDVAADVSRAMGQPVAVAPELAQRHFSGVVMIDPDHALTVRRMGAVMGIELRREGAGWRMVSPIR